MSNFPNPSPQLHSWRKCMTRIDVPDDSTANADPLGHLLKQIGDQLQLTREGGEELAAFARRLITEIDLTIPEMQKLRGYLARSAAELESKVKH